ncbi:MAG: hypothetical protein LBQ06_06110, partial [Frankiaceae bacterium]|nr:hypothetical protein [Frankiaceae bacterium]
PALAGLGAAAVLGIGGFAAARLLDSGPADRGASLDSPAPAAPSPVLLVPGYGGSVDSLKQLQAALAAAGRDARIVDLPDDARGDLAEQARVLGDAADAALAGGGPGSVDVVGYSAGGVVARIWARDLGGAAKARRIVTLGSPHHGTELASLASILPALCPAACHQLARGSDVLAALNAGGETPAGPAWVSIWSSSDGVVVPADSAVLDGALNIQVQQVCADSEVRHASLPSDPLVIGLVRLELDGAAPSAPPPDQCAALRAGG